MTAERILAALRCTVRGCGGALVRGERAFACARGHAFDVARSGYLNVLQPHDRRSLAAGDARETALARRALFEAGFQRELLAGLAHALEAAELASRTTAIDVGCGEGSLCASLADRHDLDAAGVDLSAHAIELAARAHRGVAWIVANADRGLPFVDASIDVAFSIDGRRPKDELARVVRKGGTLLVAVPAADDLKELREAVLGRVEEEDRLAAVANELASGFVLVERTLATARVRLEPAGLQALALSTYRFARAKERERLASLGARDVTTSHAIGRFARR